MKHLSGMKHKIKPLTTRSTMLGAVNAIFRFHQAFHSNHGRIRLCNRRHIKSRNDRERFTYCVHFPANKAKQNYSTIEKELLAIIHSVQFFRPYIYGRKFTLVTDHQPLKWLHSVKDLTSRLARWRLKLAEYEYEVVYKAGKINVNADALSRNLLI